MNDVHVVWGVVFQCGGVSYVPDPPPPPPNNHQLVIQSTGRIQETQFNSRPQTRSNQISELDPVRFPPADPSINCHVIDLSVLMSSISLIWSEVRNCFLAFLICFLARLGVEFLSEIGC